MTTHERIQVEKSRFALKHQPTELRRCLGCEQWMRSAGFDHRLCNRCKGDHAHGRMGCGSRVSP